MRLLIIRAVPADTLTLRQTKNKFVPVMLEKNALFMQAEQLNH